MFNSQLSSQKIGLASDERAITVVRKHWFILLRDTFWLIVGFFAPFALYAVVKGTAQPVEHAGLFVLFFGSGWFLLCWAKLFGIFTDYYLDSWTLTDRRIVAIDQRGFFNRSTASLRLERIQDITIEVQGILETLLDFGTIRVQTAAEEVEFVMKGIPRPKAFKERILSQYDPRLDTPPPAPGA